MFWRSVVAVASRTLLLQRIWRHWLLTLLEVGFVTLCFYTMLEADVPEPRSLADLRRMESSSLALGHTSVRRVLYTPTTDYSDELVRRAFASVDDPYVKLRKSSVEKGRRQVKGTQAINSTTEKFKAAQHPSDFYAGKVDKLALFQECEGASSSESRIPCILFHDASGGTNLAYSLLLFVPDIEFLPEKFPLGRMPLIKQMFLDKRVFDAAFRFQQALDTAHINMQRNMSTDVPLYHVFARQLPDPLPISDAVRYRNAFYIILTLAFSAPFVGRIHEISNELSTGLRDRQIGVGLSLGAFWVGHFLSAFTLSVAESACVMCVMLAAEMRGTQHHYLNFSEAGLVLVTFLAFSTSQTLLAFLVSSAVPLVMWSETIGFLVFTILPSWEGMDFLFDSLGSYLRTSRLSKLRLCFYPNVATAMAMKIIGAFKDFSGKVDWGISTKRALDLDNVTLLEIWLAMLFANFLTIILIWCLPYVLPWATATPQHPFFFLSPHYWSPHRTEGDAEEKPGNNDSSCFEPEPSNQRRIISATDITQNLGEKVVLNGINVNVYAFQVTVVAGPARAGKTTLLKILAGLQKPTKGRVEISNYSAVTDQEHPVNISMCHQRDLLFDDMTVKEHLAYFALIRGGSLGNLQTRIEDCLTSTGLLDKASSFPACLTGGLKRRLSIAISIITQPHILFLDEPTTGMDTETRRNVWDTISSFCGKRTVIISSHEMEEADCLADRIIVLSKGEVVCDGSPTFLKSAFNAGFKLRVSVDRSAFPFEKLLKAVEILAPQSFADYYERGELTLSLETLQLEVVSKIIKALEGKATELEIGYVTVSVATMKDLYLRVPIKYEVEFIMVMALNEIEKRERTILRHLPPWQSKIASNLRIAERLIPEYKRSRKPTNDIIKTTCAPVSRCPYSEDQLYALMAKRFSCLSRSYFVFVAGWLIPILVFCFGIYMVSAKLFTAKDKRYMKIIDLSISTQFPDTSVFVQGEPSDFTLRLVSLLRQQDASVTVTNDAYREMRTMAQNHYGHYSTQIAFGVVLNSREIELWHSPYSPITKAVGLNLITTALNQVYSGDSSARILTTLRTHNKSRLRETWPTQFMPELARNQLFWSLVPTVAFGFLVAIFSLQPAYEILSGARTLLFMTGVPRWLGVFADLAFDIAFYACPMTICLGLYVWFFRVNSTTMGALFLTVASFAPAVILLSYAIAEFSSTVQGAYATCLRLFVILGLWENPLGKWDVLGPFSMSGKSIVTDLAIVLAEGLILFAILCVSPPRFPNTCRRKTGVIENSEVDEAVAAEKAVVEMACAEENLAEYALVVNNVSKFYGSYAAVKAVSLAVRPGECLGLLGSSGAGKTTLLNLIAGTTPMSSGHCYSTTGSIADGIRKWQPYIGNCLQSGGLIETMSARSFLTLIGRLRDIPQQQVGDSVEAMLQMFDLQNLADQLGHTYTYAEKRKLSIAAALITMPPIVLLDEPFNGVDTRSKEIIAQVLKRVRSSANVAVLLATHSMDDCELTCSRVAVLSKGEIISVGKLFELKAKFSKGYTFHFVLHRVAAQDVQSFKKDVGSIFRDIKLRGRVSQNTLEYYADHKILWTDWLDTMMILEKNYVLEHVYISDTASTQTVVVVVKTKGKPFKVEDLNAGPTVL